MSRYPLAAVLALRERGEAEARRVLAEALLREHACRARRDAAVDALRSRAARAVTAGRSPSRARELQLAASCAARVREEAALLVAEVRAHEVALAAAAADVAALRDALAAARGATLAVERHRAAWRAAEARRRDGREQRAAEEVFSGPRAGR